MRSRTGRLIHWNFFEHPISALAREDSDSTEAQGAFRFPRVLEEQIRVERSFYLTGDSSNYQSPNRQNSAAKSHPECCTRALATAGGATTQSFHQLSRVPLLRSEFRRRPPGKTLISND